MPYLEWTDTNLPLPSRLTVKNVSVASRKKMESGRTLQRLRYKSQFEEGSLSFVFLNEKFQIFKGVFEHYLTNGMDWFWINLPVGGTDKLTRCQVRFIDNYTWAYKSVDNVVVNAKIEFKQVEAPNLLALENLISVGTSSLFADANPIKMTWTNVDSTASSLKKIRYYWYGQGGGGLIMANQFWEGEIYVGTAMPQQLFPVTNNEQLFVTESWSPTSINDPTPNEPQTIVGGFSFFYAAYLKYFDYKQRGGFEYMDFASQRYYEVPDQRFDIRLKSSFRYFRITSNDYLLDAEFHIDSPITTTLNANYSIDLSTLANLRTAKAVEGDYVGRVNINSIGVNYCNSLTEVDFGLTDVGAPNANQGVQYRFVNNPVLTKITMGSLTSERGRLFITNCNVLDEIVIQGDKIDIFNYNSLERNNLNIISLKNIVDKLIGSPVATPGGTYIAVGDNPCWAGGASGELFPYRWRKIDLDYITSTATDFTVKTFDGENHLLTIGDEVVLENVVRRIPVDSISSSSVQFQVNTVSDHLLTQGESIEIANTERRFGLTGITSTATEFTITTNIDHKLVAGESFIIEGAVREVAINSIASTATEFTVTALVGHLLNVGDTITISGINVAGYNATWVVDTIPTSTTFTVLDSNNYGAGGQGVFQTDFNEYNTAWLVSGTPTSNTFTVDAQDDYGIAFGGIAKQIDNAYNGTWTVQTILTSDTFLVGSAINLGTAIGGRVEQENNLFNDLWVVDSVPTADRFTILSNANADGAAGGIMKEEDNADTKYVEETALANNFEFRYS